MRLLDLFESDPTTSPQFRAWFGNSAIVDDRGKPLAVHHGTAIPKTHFRADRHNGIWGSYFTPDHAVAQDHAEIDGDDPIIYSVYLSIQNPKIVNTGIVPDKRVRGDEWSPAGSMDYQQLTTEMYKLLIADGYDGVVITNGSIADASEIVAFYSHQVKSVDNQGGWSASNIDMHEDARSTFTRGSFAQDTSRISEANLTELRIINGTGEPEIESRSIVVAFRGRVWLLPWHASMAEESVLRDMAFHIGVDMDDYDDDVGYMMDSFTDVIDNRPDIIYGYIDDGEFHMMGTQFASSVSPVTSPLIAKLVKRLGLHAATYGYTTMDGDEGRNTVSRGDMVGGLPKKLFHGTNSEIMRSIAKTGLRPGLGSNWADQGIKHDSIIFGAVGFDGAVFHANKSAGMLDTGDNMGYDPDSPFPVVLEFAIPDPDKIVPDYDVASQLIGDEHPISDRLGYTGQGGYSRQLNTMVVDHNPEGRAWKSTGIFGYTGRIPPKYITRVYTSWWSGEQLEEPEWAGTLQEFFQEWNDRYYGDQEEFDETE